MQKGGVLFVDSADKAARFIWCCDAFNIPLLFLADVPGFMVGTAGRAPGHHPPRGQDDHRGVRGDGAEGLGDRAQGVRRRALRHVRARRSSPRRAIALPTAKIAVMGPEAAVNAVFANKIAAIEDEAERAAFVGRAATRVRGRRRPAAPGVRARDRRRRPARGPARRAGRAGFALGAQQGPALQRPPPRRPARLSVRRRRRPHPRGRAARRPAGRGAGRRSRIGSR